ncbi:MAG: hypothetical protein WBD06_08065 [Acidobacteriaceae bacterium]
MERRRSPMGPPRASLGHWVIAAIFAVAVAWGMRTWLDRKAVQSSQTATLSWDAGVARQLDPSLASATDPAVATAQSILSDSVVAKLARSAPLPSSAATVRIGEFRSRLQLRQSSGDSLQVGFRDASPEQAAQMANAVADALVAGAPASAPAAAAAPPPVTAPPAAPVKPPVTHAAGNKSDALAHALGQLEAELSQTQKKVDGLNYGTWDRREHAGEPSSYRESKQQQLMTAQVGAALKEVADLRAEPANGGAAQESLRRIQDALFSVWPASRAYKGARSPADFRGFNAAGVNASRLREERAQFAHAVDVVQKEQEAVRRLEPAEAPQPAQSASESPAAQPASPPSSSGVTPPITESEILKSPAESPFQLVRPAGTPVRSPQWPPVLAGLFGAGLYLAVAGSRRRRDEEDYETEYVSESAEEPSHSITPSKPLRPADFFGNAEEQPADTSVSADPSRMITPAKPARLAEFFGKAEDRLADTSESAEEPSRMITPGKPARLADFFGKAEERPADTSESTEEPSRMITPAKPARLADFFGKAEDRPADSSERAEEPSRMSTPGKPARLADFFGKAEDRPADTSERTEEPPRPTPSAKPIRSADFFGSADARPAEVILPERTPDPPPDLEKNSEVSYEGNPMTGDAMKRPFREEVVAEEGDPDPWVDTMMKTLSETSIGRMFDKPSAQDQEENADADSRQRPIHPNRLAG